MARVSIFDLTADQAGWVEDTLDVPMDQWQSAHKGKLYPLVLAAYEAGDDSAKREALRAEYGRLPMRELLERVGDSDPEAPGVSE